MTRTSAPAARIPTITIGLRRHGAAAIAPVAATTAADDTNPAVRAILATLHALPDGGARFVFELEGDPAQLRIAGPAAADPTACPVDGPVDGLWQHTCCEVFIAVPGDEAYREFNFAPSGQWAGYAFSRYRERDPAFVARAPLIRFESSADGLRPDFKLEAELPAAALPAVAPGTDLRIALAAVIERADGELEYWAVHHPSAQPDFHHRDGFVLMLTTTAAEAA